MTFCKHHRHKTITKIKSPKWSTDEILINVNDIVDNVNDYIFQFSDESPKKKYGWFWIDGRTIRRYHKQPNGSGMVYVVPLSKREPFTPLKECPHAD